MEAPTIQAQLEAGILTITLNRPEKYNALTSAALRDLGAIVEDATSRAEIQALVVTGAGKAFSSGMDLAEVGALMALSPPERRALLRKWNRSFSAFEILEKPVVAALNGPTLGAGLEIALACDVRIAARTATLGLVETRLGAAPDGGGCTRLARHVGLGRAKEMIMSGGPVGAEVAERWGLVNRVVEPADLPAAATAFARELLQGGPLGIGVAKRLIVQAFGLDAEAGIALEGLVASHLYGTEDVRAAYEAFREKRKPEFRGR